MWSHGLPATSRLHTPPTFRRVGHSLVRTPRKPSQLTTPLPTVSGELHLSFTGIHRRAVNIHLPRRFRRDTPLSLTAVVPRTRLKVSIGSTRFFRFGLCTDCSMATTPAKRSSRGASRDFRQDLCSETQGPHDHQVSYLLHLRLLGLGNEDSLPNQVDFMSPTFTCGEHSSDSHGNLAG